MGIDNNPDLREKYPIFKASSVSGPGIYYMGIVDFLQDWSTKKKIERTLKIYLTRKDPEGLSVMEPISYKDRFQTKMKQIFEVEDLAPPVAREKDAKVSKSDSPRKLNIKSVSNNNDVYNILHTNLDNNVGIGNVKTPTKVNKIGNHNNNKKASPPVTKQSPNSTQLESISEFENEEEEVF